MKPLSLHAACFVVTVLCLTVVLHADIQSVKNAQPCTACTSLNHGAVHDLLQYRTASSLSIRQLAWEAHLLHRWVENEHCNSMDVQVVIWGCLLQHFIEQCNGKLAAELADRKNELSVMRTTDRVKLAVRLRLQMLIPYMGEQPGRNLIQACSTRVSIVSPYPTISPTDQTFNLHEAQIAVNHVDVTCIINNNQHQIVQSSYCTCSICELHIA